MAVKKISACILRSGCGAGDACYGFAVKRRLAWILAGLSGIYLLIAGPIPDPLPFIDEATALLVFVKSMAYLGYDVRRWLPFLGKGRGGRPSGPKGVTIDV